MPAGALCVLCPEQDVMRLLKPRIRAQPEMRIVVRLRVDTVDGHTAVPKPHRRAPDNPDLARLVAALDPRRHANLPLDVRRTRADNCGSPRVPLPSLREIRIVLEKYDLT